jgi:hypothetical protein
LNPTQLKVRLVKLGKSQNNLLLEVRKKGYPKLSQPAFNAYINRSLVTPQAEKVMEAAENIIKEWEGK